MNTTVSTLRHTIIKLSKARDKESTLKTAGEELLIMNKLLTTLSVKFSAKMTVARQLWGGILNLLNNNNNNKNNLLNSICDKLNFKINKKLKQFIAHGTALNIF